MPKIKACVGVRHIKGNSYQVNFRPFPKANRVYKFVIANSMQEASLERAKLLVEHANSNKEPSKVVMDRRQATLDQLESVIVSDLQSDNRVKKSIKRFVGCWRNFCRFLSKEHPDITNINKLDTEHFKDYQDYVVLTQERKNGWRAELIVLQATFNRLNVRGYVDDDTIKALKKIKRPPKNEKKDFPDIPDSKIRKMIKFIEQDRPDFYGLTVTLFKCGWRIEETTLLKKANITWAGLKPALLKIESHTTKTKVGRLFDYFDNELTMVFRHYAFAKRKTIWLFPNRNNDNIKPKKYRRYLKKISKQILGMEITPHYFRHRLCTVASRNNISIADLQGITGIRDIKVLLQYYQHATPIGKQKVLELSKLK